MRYFILTSDRYSKLLEGYIELWQRHWDEDIQMEILGFDDPNVMLPDNFSFHSLGKQSDHPVWAEPLLDFFGKLDSDEFFLCFEDHFLIKDVNVKMLNEGIEHVKSGSVDKLFLMDRVFKSFTHGDKYVIKEKFEGGWCLASSMITPERDDHFTCGCSLLPSVWNKKFFLDILNDGITDMRRFERYHSSDEELTNATGRTPKILVPKDTTVYAPLDAMRKGGFNTPVFSTFTKNRSGGKYDYEQNICEEDMDVFRKMYNKWING